MARLRWQAQPLRNYVYIFQLQSCFCDEIDTTPVRVTVEDGEVVAAEYTSPDFAEFTPAVSQFLPVEALFDSVEDTIKDADCATVSYDEEMGYPRSVSADWALDGDDDEETYSIRMVD